MLKKTPFDSCAKKVKCLKIYVSMEKQEKSCDNCKETRNCEWFCANCAVVNVASYWSFKTSAKMWKVLFKFEFGFTFRLSMQRGIHMQHQRPEIHIWSVACNRFKNCILPDDWKYFKYWNLYTYDLSKKSDQTIVFCQAIENTQNTENWDMICQSNRLKQSHFANRNWENDSPTVKVIGSNNRILPTGK